VRDGKGQIGPWAADNTFTLGIGLPPLWAFGIGWSRYHYETSAEVREVMDISRREGIPGDWVHPDFAWGGHYDTMKWSEGFADARKLMEEMRGRGFRLMPIDHHGISAEHDPERAAFLLSKGWLDQSQPGPGDRKAIDFRNAEARAWYVDNYLRPLYEDGVGGWKLDGTCGWGSLWRNRDDRLWDLYHKMFFDAQQLLTEGGNGRGFITARTMSKPYPGVWTDDIPGTWGTFASQIQVLGALAREDVPYVMADAGGFNSRMTPEGFVRWSQQALLSPLIWTHDGNEPWRFYGEDAMRVFRDFAILRYRMLPYLYSLSARNYADGTPISRPMEMEFPEAEVPDEMRRDLGPLQLGFFHHYASPNVKGDGRVRLIETQVMLGPNLLIAPVIDPAPWEHPDFRNLTEGDGRYLATYITPEAAAFDEALQTVEIASELAYRIRLLDLPNPTITLGFCALPRWKRGASGMPPMDIIVEGKTVASIDPLDHPGERKPLPVSFPAVDADGDGWVDVRIRASAEPPARKGISADEWEQELAGKAWFRNVFANAIWQHDGKAVAPDDLLAGRASAPFRMNLGVFNQELEGLTANRTLWIPPGQWADWFTGEIFDGPRLATMEVPIERMPLFIRAGGIIPLGPEIDHTGQKPLDPVTLVVFPGAQPSSFTLYEDDGVTRDHQRGIFAESRISVSARPEGGILLRVPPPEGPYAGKLPVDRKWIIELIGSRPASVTLQPPDGPVTEPEWKYDDTSRRTVIQAGTHPRGFEVVITPPAAAAGARPPMRLAGPRSANPSRTCFPATPHLLPSTPENHSPAKNRERLST